MGWYESPACLALVVSSTWGPPVQLPHIARILLERCMEKGPCRSCGHRFRPGFVTILRKGIDAVVLAPYFGPWSHAMMKGDSESGLHWTPLKVGASSENGK